DRLERIGQPNVGWMNDETSISPTRPGTSEAGLRGGGQALRVNGVAISPDLQATHVAGVLHTEIRATHTLHILTPRRGQRELTFTVKPWSWHDFLFTMGASDIIGLLFAVVGIASFVLRPYEAASWALLSMACVSGGALLTVFLPIDRAHIWNALYFLAVVG